jgi:hypothetical protein
MAPCRFAVFVEPAAVDERLLDKIEVPNREPQAFGQRGRLSHRSRRCAEAR